MLRLSATKLSDRRHAVRILPFGGGPVGWGCGVSKEEKALFKAANQAATHAVRLKIENLDLRVENALFREALQEVAKCQDSIGKHCSKVLAAAATKNNQPT